MTDEEKFLCRCACRRCTKQDEEECKTCEYNYYDKEGKRMRLIDADALIDILRNSHESHATNSREESLLARDIRLVQEQAKYHPIIIEERPHGEWKKESAIDYLTEIGWLPEHDRILTERPQWIPCSERLPEKSGEYYVSGGDKVWICSFLIIPTFRGGWCNNVSNPVVEAWMPLPTPYREEGE